MIWRLRGEFWRGEGLWRPFQPLPHGIKSLLIPSYVSFKTKSRGGMHLEGGSSVLLVVCKQPGELSECVVVQKPGSSGRTEALLEKEP